MKGPGGMDMGRLMKQAQEMQKQMAKTKEDLKDRVVQGEAGGGAIVATVNGVQDLIAIKIQKEAVDPEAVDMLEDLVVAAVGVAMKKSREMSEAQMGKVTGGLPMMPGMGM